MIKHIDISILNEADNQNKEEPSILSIEIVKGPLLGSTKTFRFYENTSLKIGKD